VILGKSAVHGSDRNGGIAVETMTLVVGPDGRVKIPGTKAGQLVTVRIEGEPVERPPLTPEERERIIREQMEESRQTRESADPKKIARALNHGEWLYGPDGLPR
jgi:hypothetical protein